MVIFFSLKLQLVVFVTHKFYGIVTYDYVYENALNLY